MTDNNPLVYRAEELVPLLKVSRSTVFQWLREGKIRSRRCGKVILIPAAAIQEFLETKSNK
jgi:excisionase family DNA binding protein